MTKIQINLLIHNSDRLNFTLKSLDFLKKIKNENKEKIKLVIFGGEQNDYYRNLLNDLISNNIQTEYIFIAKSSSNYLNKIRYCVDNTNLEYSCSMDEDILISNFLWDYIIENVDVLQDNKNLFLSPLISNGIPTVDLFIEDFFNNSEKESIHKLFTKIHIDNYWGVDYSSLNNLKETWDYKNYYNNVKKINHHYKGIHPVRISYDAHLKIAEVVCNNPKKIIENSNFYIENFNFPYFCNSFFIIKTNTWKKIIHDKELYRDMFDEVPLNLYMEKNNLNMCFIRNGFCLHMAYNTIGSSGQKNIENYYYNNFLTKI